VLNPPTEAFAEKNRSTSNNDGIPLKSVTREKLERWLKGEEGGQER